MKRTWRVTLQGDPTRSLLVATETSSALQKDVAQDIKVKVQDLGYDPRLIIDWEMEWNLDARLYAYWCPGGRTGEVLAETPYEAAQVVLRTDEVLHSRGETLNQPWVYVGGQSECKLWIRKSGPADSY